MALMRFTRRFVFQAVHSVPDVVETEPIHGHHYFVDITYFGCGRDLVDSCFERYVEPRLHCRDLTQEFHPATGEHLVEWIHSRLADSPLANHLAGVALQETAKNRFVSSGSEARLV